MLAPHLSACTSMRGEFLLYYIVSNLSSAILQHQRKNIFPKTLDKLLKV